VSFAWFGSGGVAAARDIKDASPYIEKTDYASSKDWNLKSENIVPHGHNPLYFPLKPGHKHIHERPDHPDGAYRKEIEVLDETEDFDVPGIGKFKTAVVQEEEYTDGVLTGRSRYWSAIDKTTNSVYAFGEVTWEVDENHKLQFVETWRAGEPDGSGMAEPAMLMPGKFTIGARYISNGSNSAASGAENMEAGLKITVPAGTFENCVRVRELNLRTRSDLTHQIMCPLVGPVSDSDGKLVASSALPPAHPGSDVSSVGTLRNNAPPYPPPVPKISADEAVQIALRTIPGRVDTAKIVRKRGKYLWAVDIVTSDGRDKDVLVDIETGEVAGSE
jgi:hypothetical protein